MASPFPSAEAEIARLRREGYEVEDRTADQVILVRTSPWTTHWLGVLFGGLLGGGVNRSPRTQRIYLFVDADGGAQIRMAPRARNPPEHLA